MTDYISREAAVKAIEKHAQEMSGTRGVGLASMQLYQLGFMHAIDVLDTLPAANVQPVVKGEWEYWAGGLPECPVCGYEYTDYLECDNFCPNCGADMRKGDGNADV